MENPARCAPRGEVEASEKCHDSCGSLARAVAEMEREEDPPLYRLRFAGQPPDPRQLRLESRQWCASRFLVASTRRDFAVHSCARPVSNARGLSVIHPAPARRYNSFSGRADAHAARSRFPPPPAQRPRPAPSKPPVESMPLRDQLRHLFGTSQSQSQESSADLGADESAAPQPPPAPAAPRPTLRYVVPPKDAAEKENEAVKPANAGKKRSRASREKDPNQITLSQVFAGDGRRDAHSDPNPEPSSDPDPGSNATAAAAGDDARAPPRVEPASKRIRSAPGALACNRLARDVDEPATLAEFHACLSSASAVAIGVLLRDGVGERRFGFRSNLRPDADVAAAKEARKAARDAAKPAPAPEGGWASAVDVHTVAFAVVFLGAKVPDAGDGAGGAAFVFRVDPKTRGFVSAAAADAMVAATSLGAPLVTHHAQAVVRRLHRAGIRIDPSRVDVLDSRAMAWLAAPDDSHESGARRVDETLVRLERKLDGNSTDSRGAASRPPLERFRAEILEGAALVQRLRRLDRVRVAADAARREGRVAAILGQLEDVGVGFDASYVDGAIDRLRDELASLESAAAASLGGERVNLAAPHRVAEALYDRLGLPKPSDAAMTGSKTGQLTTKDDALRALAARDLHPLPGIVLRHRATLRQVAMCASYAALASSSRDGRLRCEWNNTRTATGRLSSSNPNLQAVGRAESLGGAFTLRGAFVAPPGKVLIAADYSQIELRVLAHLAEDPRLAGLLRRAADDGGDVFKLIWNAARSSPPDAHVSPADRDRAKTTVYGIIYGQGKAGLAEKLGTSRDAAAATIATVFAAFPRLRHFVRCTREDARRTGRVALPSGRHRPLPGFASVKSSEVAEAERRAVNTLVQGTAADLMKRAMVRWAAATAERDEGNVRGGGVVDPGAADVARAANPREVRLVAQIHDELLFECDEDPAAVARAAEAARRCMEAAAPELAVPTPAKVSVGRTWAELRPLGKWLADAGTRSGG